MTPSSSIHRPREIDIRDLVNVPYVEGGTDRARDGGLSCWGVVRLALRQLGVRLPADPAEILALADAIAVQVPFSTIAHPGDLYELDGRAAGFSGRHLAVALDAFEFLHATADGSRVARFSDWLHAGRARKHYRLRALIPEGQAL